MESISQSSKRFNKRKNCNIISNIKNETIVYKFAKMISDVYISFLLPHLNPIKEQKNRNIFLDDFVKIRSKNLTILYFGKYNRTYNHM